MVSRNEVEEGSFGFQGGVVDSVAEHGLRIGRAIRSMGSLCLGIGF